MSTHKDCPVEETVDLAIERVTQEDREAAIKLLPVLGRIAAERDEEWSGLIRSGKWDHHPFVEALSAHRRAALPHP